MPAGKPLLRVVSSGLPGLEGTEHAFATDTVTIGRADDCTIPLKDTRISRHHAHVERTSEGFRLVDEKSANGVFVDGKQVFDLILTPGTKFRVGDTVFELVVPPPPAPPPEESGGTLITSARPELIVRVAESKSGDAVGKEFRVPTGVATLGRSEDNVIVLADNGASRHHARIECLGPDQFRVVDTGSANGIWISDRRITEAVLSPGQRFRIGDTFLECVLPPKERPGSSSTQIIKDLPMLMAKAATERLTQAGEPIPLSGSRVVLLDDPRFVYYVIAGSVEVFTVTVKDGRPLGARNHFLTLKPGEAFFGVGLGLVRDSGFLATGKTGTEVRRIARADIATLADEPFVRLELIRLVDTWVAGLSARLTRDVFPRPEADLRVEAGKKATLAKGQRAKAAAGVVWCPVEPDRLLYIGMSTLFPDRAGTVFPLVPQTWLEPAGDTTVDLEPVTTESCLGDGRLWNGLDCFHQVLAECEFINKRLAVVDEFQRLDSKARHSEAAREAAYDAIGAVLAGQHAASSELTPSSRAEPVLEACQAIGRVLGITVRSPVESRTARTFDDQLGAIATASRFRTRRVVLRGEWWRHDQGPLLARIEAGGTPVAILPNGPRSYRCVDPTTRVTQPVTPDLAGTLAPFGYVFYRPFPPGALTVRDVLRFGARGLAPDLRLIVAMGVLTGVLGVAAPYLTGQMVDAAIPQGDRGLLLQLGMGMLFTAFATAAFKIAQSFAVVRVESRMDYYLQAALWDRLLDLPSEFFRKYGAGDLAERAAGINAIRGLISRAGVTGILGSMSSVAYVAMMLSYNLQLTLVAMGITAILVGITTVGNLSQLRYQREETRQRGLIASLVLQLIAGIAKVRVSAAENHAFRVWAQRFAGQKRIGFSIGQIQNIVATLSSAFPVLSSLGLFGALYYFQTSAPPGQPPPFTTGTFVAFNAAFGTFVAAMQALSDASLNLLKAVPIYERLAPILTAVPETDESKAHPGRLRGGIAVTHLQFRYHADSPFILKDVSLSIQPGEFVAFVGSSGCGKSTLIRLLLGFEHPTLGSVSYDGQDLATIDARTLRQQLGVVLQESRVLPTDIYRNIVGTTSHTMDEAWEAAEMAGLAEDIRQMPMGMHTVVSEGGGTFSGGQRQRLLIARALVNKPRVIFFDEATSALDNRTQAVVTQSMDRLDATRIVIAHRLSTVANADRIYYFDGGQIREQGNYNELMAKNGLFAQLARRQIA